MVEDREIYPDLENPLFPPGKQNQFFYNTCAGRTELLAKRNITKHDDGVVIMPRKMDIQ